MDYSFQIDMGMRDRKKNKMMTNTNGHFKKVPNSYAEQFKRQKKKPSRVKTIKRTYGSEEDLVKTGSEDEDDLDLEKQLELARKARPKRAERSKPDSKDELINFKQRNNRSIYNQENYKPRTYTADNVLNVHKKSMSPMSNKSYPLRRPLHSHAFPPSAESGEIHFSPQFFNMYQVQENLRVPKVENVETPNLEIDKEREDGGSRYEQMRSEARRHRLSILNRAEKLVENISRSDQVSSDDGSAKILRIPKERRRKRSTRNKSRDIKYLQDRDSSTSGDEKYVLVKTTVSPEPIEEVGAGVPRFVKPVPRNISDNSLNSAGKTEIPVESDDEENYTEQRPAAEVFMSQSHTLNEQKRFEAITEKQEEFKKGRLVTFFRNGDQVYKGYRMSITPKVRNFETLLVHLNDKIPTTSGVRYVFSLPDGKEIKSVTEFKPGRAYLVSSNKKVITNLPYGHLKDGDWSTAKLPADKFRKDEKHLFQRRAGSPTQSPTRKARVITVENNNPRRLIKEKIIIDPQTKQNFEDILAIIGDLLHMNVHSLYTRRKPFKQVVSFSQLFREFQLHDMFIACQEGEEPIERSSLHTDRGSRNNNISVDEINITGSSPSESPPPMENGFLSNRSDDDIEDDSISVQINGKTRRYYPPSLTYQDEEGGKPDRKLKLEWIYGYHAKENGNNLFVLYSGEVAYAVASVVVLFNYARNKQDKQRDRDSRDSVRDFEDTQRLYLGHTEEISSMALHPNNRYMASGQVSGKENKAHIRVWDSKLLTTLNVIGVGFFDHGIISIDFSQQSTGSFICVMDNADKHVLSIWDWQKERMVAKTTTTTLPVKTAVFYKYNDTILITYGQQHVYFWKLFWDPVREKEGRIMRDKRSGLFLGEIPNEICSLTFSAKGDVLTGDSTGSVVVWSPDIEYIFSVNLDLSETMRNAHKNPVTTLHMLVDNTLMTGGGLEIRAWDSLNGYRPANARVLPEATGHVKTIVPQHSNAADGRLYVATTKGHVLDGSLQDKFRFFLQGHSEEIWAVAPHPNESSFFTTSFDRVVIKWSTNKHKIAWKTQMPKPGSCLTTDLKGRQVAVGTQSGSVELLNAHNGMHASSIDISKYRIDCIAFSPDGTMIAAGCHDGLIHILDIQDGAQGYIPSRPLKGHPTFVTHIDWSSDSKYIQSTDGQYNMINWDIEKRLKINDPRVLRDADWHSYSCTAGFPVIGPWSSIEPGIHINAVHRSNYRDYMLTGDSRGRVRFYKNPCPAIKPEYRGVKLYSSDVTAACFMYDDMNVITAGGSSPVLAQWSVVDAIVSS